MKCSNAGANFDADSPCRSSNGNTCPCSSTTVVTRYGDRVALSPVMPDLAVLEGLWVVAPTSGLTFDLTTGRFAAIDVPRLDLRRTLRAVWVGPRVPARCSSAIPAESHHLSGSNRMITGHPS